jgi:glutathione peroxidase
MKRLIYKISKAFAFVISIISLMAASSKKYQSPIQQGANLHDFKLKTIDGKEITLGQFKGKKLLLVNVASECGYTPQYKNLQALHEKYKDKLVVIGFPANNFGGQEPGTNEEIKGFCSKTYQVSFLMMEKISVKGKDTHPLYQWLCNKSINGTCDDSPSWNFCKYLIDENGHIVKFFKSSVDPLSAEITGLL